MLDEKRVREMFWLFARVLPIDEKAGDLFGVKVAKLLPETCVTIGNYSANDTETFEMYLIFIEQAIKYMRNETDDQPQIDHNQEEISKQMRDSLARKT